VSHRELLDRYAARKVIRAPLQIRIAVLGARSAPQKHWARDQRGITMLVTCRA
jgi:hypothetical protein